MNIYLFHWMPSKAIWIGGQTPSWDARCAGIYFGFGLGVLYQLAKGRAAWRMPSVRFLAVTAFLMLPLFLDIFAIYADILESLCVFGFLSLLVILSTGMVKTVRTIVLARGAARLVVPVVLMLMLAGCVAPARTMRSGPCDERDFVPSPMACLDCKRETCQDGKIVLVEDPALMAPVDDWAEERFCLRHPFNCFRAYALKQKLERWQKDLVGTYWADEGLHNGLGDAARHSYLMCELTERYGETFARALGVAHEEDSGYLIFVQMGIPGNPCCEKASDLYNNEVGISLAGQPGSCEEKTLRSLHLLRHSQCRSKDKVMER